MSISDPSPPLISGLVRITNLIRTEVRASERKWLNLVAQIMLLTEQRAQNTSKSVRLEDQTISICHAEVRHSLLLAWIRQNLCVTFYRICKLQTDKSPQAKMSVSLPSDKIVWCSHWIFWNILTSMIFAYYDKGKFTLSTSMDQENWFPSSSELLFIFTG